MHQGKWSCLKKFKLFSGTCHINNEMIQVLFFSMNHFKCRKNALRSKPVIRDSAKSYFGDIKQFLVSLYNVFFQVKNMEKENKNSFFFTMSMITISFLWWILLFYFY